MRTFDRKTVTSLWYNEQLKVNRTFTLYLPPVEVTFTFASTLVVAKSHIRRVAVWIITIR